MDARYTAIPWKGFKSAPGAGLSPSVQKPRWLSLIAAIFLSGVPFQLRAVAPPPQLNSVYWSADIASQMEHLRKFHHSDGSEHVVGSWSNYCDGASAAQGHRSIIRRSLPALDGA